jgi:hypothetical protein
MAHFNNKGSDENVFEAMNRQGSGVTFDDDGMPLIYKLQPQKASFQQSFYKIQPQAKPKHQPKPKRL